MAKLFRFSFQIAGGQRLDRALSVTASQVDLRLCADQLRAIFNKHRKADFARQGAHSGSRWAPLTPAYKKAKAKFYPGKPILHRTGNLMSSLVNPSHPQAVFVATRSTVTMGTTDTKAIYHQTGGTHLPARPPIRMKESERRAYMQIIHESIVKNLRSQGLGGEALGRRVVNNPFGQPAAFGTAPRTWAADD